MNIVVIKIGEPFFFDSDKKKMRAGLLAEALASRGHKVHLISSAFSHFEKRWVADEDMTETRGNMTVTALRSLGYRKNISLKRFLDYRYLAFRCKAFLKKCPRPDLIILSTPPYDIAAFAADYARSRKIPYLVDIRDQWPDMFFEGKPEICRKIFPIIMFYEFWLIRRLLSGASSVTAVTESYLRWGLKYARREKTDMDKVFPLSYQNHPISADAINQTFQEIAERLRDKFIIFFVGSISRSYHNPLIMLEAAKRMAVNSEIHFVIAGDGELGDDLRAQSVNLANVTCVGWLTHAEISFWLGRSKVGVCPSNDDFDIPTNKIYAYLSAGMPVISSFGGAMRRLVEDESIGIYYKPADVDAFVAAVERLHSDRAFYDACALNAQKAFARHGNADRVYQDFADLVERIAGNVAHR